VVSSLDEENSLRPNRRVRDTDPFAGSLDMVNANRIHEGKTDEKIRDCTRFRVPRYGLLSKSTSVNHEGCRKWSNTTLQLKQISSRVELMCRVSGVCTRRSMVG
jgi:hypothetical protein